MDILDIKAREILDKGYIRSGDKVVIGLSGGGDSVALLVALLIVRKTIDYSLKAVHVHHGIREKADEDQHFVEQLCSENKVELVVKRENVPALSKELGIGCELAGRMVRKNAFEKEAAGGRLFLAHHANDQEETVLMNFLRGSGLSGLGGMKEEVACEGAAGYVTVRPFLDVTHEELLSALRSRGISWCEDESNLEPVYTRNIFRLRILPLLKEYYPGLTNVMLRNAQIMRETEDYLKHEADLFIREHATENSINAEALLCAEPALAHSVIRRCLEKTVGLVDISRKNTEDILGLARLQSGRYIELPGGRTVRKSFDRLIFREETVRERLCITRADIKEIDISAIKNDYAKWFDCDKISRYSKEPVEIRRPLEGDYLIIDHAGHKKDIRRYLKQIKLDAKKREDILVAAAGKLVLYVAGYRNSCGFEVDENSKNVIKIYREEL